ncbi:MAG: hypothetical protein ABI721_03425 [Candidatus Dojkabacteria bacterium]
MKFEINKIVEDEFGRPNGILILDKPVGITSHDLVYETRKKYGTKKVGHAGTLDPFASGQMIVLLGKATKLSDSFLGLDKEYEADIAFGVSTTTGDPEGEIKELRMTNEELQINLKKLIKEFPKEYLQYVPIYSSVKIKGEKLRELARGTDRFEITDADNGEDLSKKSIKFYKNDNLVFESKLPAKIVKIYELEILDFSVKKLEEYKNTISKDLFEVLKQKDISELPIAKIRVKCSKGTYIRQLAEDIGVMLDTPAFLVALRRTKIFITDQTL